MEIDMASNTFEIRYRTRPHWGYLVFGVVMIAMGAMGLHFGWTGRSGHPATDMQWFSIGIGLLPFLAFGITQKTIVDLSAGRMRHWRTFFGLPFYLRRADTADITSVILNRFTGTKHDSDGNPHGHYVLAVEMGLDRIRIEYSGDYDSVYQRARDLADTLDVELLDMGTDEAIIR
jgi:hypothetical protein